jgi:hypothetical protein
MRVDHIVTASALVVVSGFSVSNRQAPAKPPKVQITYDAFMALDDKQRADRFDSYDPETKSVLMRTHTQRWLEKNQQRLSRSQIELVHELIAYLSPDAYRNAGSLENQRRSQELYDKLKCRIRHSDLVMAVGPHRKQPPGSWMNDVWFWFNECVIG